MGRQRGGLDLKTAKALLVTALKMATGEPEDGEGISRIDVVGTFDDDEKANLNLLQYLMREQEEVPVDQTSRRMLYADRRVGIAKAFETRRTELERRFVRKQRG